jgi:hypothetical protein
MRLKNPITAALGAAFLCALPLATWPARAAPCMAHETLAGYLAERFAERPHGLGLIRDQHVLELFVSAGGTWSIVLTDSRGVACLVMAGESWDQVPPPPTPEF